jgi:Arc/MetJ-type ribon-helix-helix transcriptional regulator
MSVPRVRLSPLNANAIKVGYMYDLGMTAKDRLSVTVDADLIYAAQAAVASGDAESVSAWVNDALRQKADHERRLRGLDEFIKAYEAEYGEITEEEMDAAVRSMRARAIVVRGGEVQGDAKRPGVA